MRRGMKRAILAGLAFLVGTNAAAQENVFFTELYNGLDVIVLENRVVPLVTIEIDVRNGSYTESPEFNGLSHLYEHMFFKANETLRDQASFNARVRELGMSRNGTTSEEQVNYFFTLSNEDLEEGLEFMRDAITAPLFEQEELIRERPVVTGELDRLESNPFYQLSRAMDLELWSEYSSRKDISGSREILMTATQQKMRTVQERYYIPNNSALIVAGDVDHDQVFALAEEYFNEWERGPDPFELYPVPEHPPLTSNQLVVVTQPVSSVAIQIGLHGPSVSKDPGATYAADVLSYITRQRNSEFQQELVESGLCAGASLGYYTLDYTGPITIICQTTADRYEAANAAIHAQINRLAAPDYFTDEQLENAKTQLEIGELYSRERPSTFIHILGFWWSVTNGLDYYESYIDNLRRVDRTDIADYVHRYIQDQYYVTGVLASPEDHARLGLSPRLF